MTRKTKFKVGDPVVIKFAFSKELLGMKGIIDRIDRYGQYHVVDYAGNHLGNWGKDDSFEFDEIYFTPLFQALK